MLEQSDASNQCRRQMVPALDIPARIPRAALVTGAAHRIGRTIAVALAKAGFDIAVHCHTNRDAGVGTCEAIRRLGRRACLLRADLGNEAATPGGCFRKPAAALGPIGVLVNNASPFERDEWHDATPGSWDAPYRAEPARAVRADAALARAIAGRGRRRGDQHAGPAGLVDDAALRVLHRREGRAVGVDAAMALALAPRIRVNGIGPGPALPSPRQSQAQFDTAMRLGAAAGTAPAPTRSRRAVLALLPLPAMTGQMLALDGGQHLQWPPAATGRRPRSDAHGSSTDRQRPGRAPRVPARHGAAASIGVHPHEQHGRQRVRINVDSAWRKTAQAAVAPAGRRGRDGAGGGLREAWRNRCEAIVAAGHSAGRDAGRADGGSLPRHDGGCIMARVRVEKLDMFADVRRRRGGGTMRSVHQRRLVHSAARLPLNSESRWSNKLTVWVTFMLEVAAISRR